MNRTAFVITIGILSASSAIAAQGFSCGGADVSISVIGRDSQIWENRPEAVVTVTKEGYNTILRYRNLDFIGGECVSRPNAKPLIVFQAYCGGSGCKDRANWGVIDPEFLKVLTVPSDFNRDEVQNILGSGPLPHLKMMSVLSEARTLGIQIP